MTGLPCMSIEDMMRSLKTSQLELQYQEALRQVEKLYAEEKLRSQRVVYLLLEDETLRIEEQRLEDENEMHELENTNDKLQFDLATVEENMQELQNTLTTCERELRQCKAECVALHTANLDSEKLLSEKLALTREMATLRPQVDHLKSQAASQENFLAQKLALERELSAVQVELENEKRAVQRMKAQDKVAGHGETVMISEIENLKKELAKERKNSQKTERDHMKKATDWDNQKETIEGKLEAFRSKLRTTKEQLKEAQEELERVQTAKFAQSAEATKARMTGGNPRKRNVARFDPDMTIGTPGNGGQAKKQKTSINPSEKSTFSITPFLNKTISILPESPAENATDAVTNVAQNSGDDAVALSDNDFIAPMNKLPMSKSTSKQLSKPRSTPSEPLKETTKAKANKVVKKPSLPKVTEEDVEPEAEAENVKPPKNLSTGLGEDAKSTRLFANRPTIFDDDDDSAPKRATKRLNLTGLRGSSSTVSIGKLNLGGKNKFLAEFSPLKKDRRVVV